MLALQQTNNRHNPTFFVDGPFQRPTTAMDRFDKLVLRAAKKKRKDLVNRYGDDRCSKLLQTRKDLQVSLPEPTPISPNSKKSQYKKTILELKKAHEELTTSLHSYESQKSRERTAQTHYESSDSDATDDDSDIEALFELAWGNDISQQSQTTTTNHRNSPNSKITNYRTKPKPQEKKLIVEKQEKKNVVVDDKSKDFCNYMKQRTARKLLKVREQETAPKKIRKDVGRRASPSCSPIPPMRKTL